MEAILIPVKHLDYAKRRLGAHLAPEERRRLGLSMLTDVLRATDMWTDRWIVTSDPDAEALGLSFGCRLVADRGEGLNSAIADATGVICDSAVLDLLVLPADVPLVTGEAISDLFAAKSAVVVSPSRTGGTNALLRRPPDAIYPLFGDDSADAHARSAQERGLKFETLFLPSLVLDIDEPDDLATLAGSDSERESVRVARLLMR